MNPLPPVDAVLAIDVGNTRIGLAVCDSDGVHDAQRIGSRAPDTWKPALEQTWAAIPQRQTRAIVLSSVAPDPAKQISALIKDLFDITPLRVRDDLPLPMPLDIENPHEIGVDRVCCAAAAYDRVREACAVASFGTATTIDCVSAEGRFLGGAILPGLEMGGDALHNRTAALPRVQLAAPRGAFGKNTHDAIVNGIVYGAVGALREIVERFATELGRWPQLVVTGGNAALIREQADFIDALVPDLSLMGIALAYRRAAAGPS